MTRQELKEWRRRWGLSQERLARLLGVGRSCVARWEIGTRGIPAFLRLALKGLEIQLKVDPRGVKGEKV